MAPFRLNEFSVKSLHFTMDWITDRVLCERESLVLQSLPMRCSQAELKHKCRFLHCLALPQVNKENSKICELYLSSWWEEYSHCCDCKDKEVGTLEHWGNYILILCINYMPQCRLECLIYKSKKALALRIILLPLVRFTYCYPVWTMSDKIREFLGSAGLEKYLEIFTCEF